MKTLRDALQTDIANSGTSHAESLDEDTDGLATRCARWLFAASLAEINPRGLTEPELAEYLLAPGHSIRGMRDALKRLYDTCWYIQQTKSGRYLFQRHKNLNAQINSCVYVCSNADRDKRIEGKLKEMFAPKDKACYQKLAVLPALGSLQLERDKATLVIEPLRNRVETFLFLATDRTTWDQIKDGAASRGHMLWTQSGTLDRMREALLTSGTWREEAGQHLKPPFDEVTSVTVEYARDAKSGTITTTDIKLAHGAKLYVREDAGEWEDRSADEAMVSDAMRIELKAVDSTGKNQEGKPNRIDNGIDLDHAFMPSPTAGHQVIKVKVVPPATKLLFTLDGSNPANNGAAYTEPGIDAPDGAMVRLFAERGGVTREMSIQVPKPVAGGGGAGGDPVIDPALPAVVNGKAFGHLVTRKAAYDFLNGPPAEARLQMVQAKVTVAATDSTVTLTWDRKTRLAPAGVMLAFEFLDEQVPEGEWSLRFSTLHFATGKALLEWQVQASSQIDPSQITQ